MQAWILFSATSWFNIKGFALICINSNACSISFQVNAMQYFIYCGNGGEIWSSNYRSISKSEPGYLKVIEFVFGSNKWVLRITWFTHPEFKRKDSFEHPRTAKPFTFFEVEIWIGFWNRFTQTAVAYLEAIMPTLRLLFWPGECSAVSNIWR